MLCIFAGGLCLRNKLSVLFCLRGSAMHKSDNTFYIVYICCIALLNVIPSKKWEYIVLLNISINGRMGGIQERCQSHYATIIIWVITRNVFKKDKRRRIKKRKNITQGDVRKSYTDNIKLRMITVKGQGSVDS